jgi:hypothetical protein
VGNVYSKCHGSKNLIGPRRRTRKGDVGEGGGKQAEVDEENDDE